MSNVYHCGILVLTMIELLVYQWFIQLYLIVSQKKREREVHVNDKCISSSLMFVIFKCCLRRTAAFLGRAAQLLPSVSVCLLLVIGARCERYESMSEAALSL